MREAANTRKALGVFRIRFYTQSMPNQQFKPPPAEYDVEVQIDGKTHKGRYHLEHDNIVVSYQGASKLAPQGADNASLAKTLLNDIVTAKHRQA
jgi:hypothetical protein